MVEITIRDTETGTVTEKTLLNAVIVGTDTGGRTKFWLSTPRLPAVVVFCLAKRAIDAASLWLIRSGYDDTKRSLCLGAVIAYAKNVRKHPKSVDVLLSREFEAREK